MHLTLLSKKCNQGRQMYSFLVLGRVPGTNLQISFQNWLVLAAVLAFAAIVIKLQITFRSEAYATATSRVPLHASRLHQRAL